MNQNIKVFIVLLCCLFWLSRSFCLNHKTTECPVTVFYGLNESHSNHWAFHASNGLIGVSYYNKTNSTLYYRCIDSYVSFSDEVVTTGEHLETSIILFDSVDSPHIFVASSDSLNQQIRHFFKHDGIWQNEIIINYFNEGGSFIYELSGVIDHNDKFHLLILKTNNNPDSENYYMAFADAHLYYLNNSNSNCTNELVHNYNTIWTLDEYSKMMNRQDIAVDANNKPHIIFGEQINAMSNYSPSRLCYAHKTDNSWIIETAFDYNQGSRDDAGWYPALEIDNFNNPAIGCCYIDRVSTGSAIYAKLFYLKRTNSGNWQQEIVCTQDDGYYGSDGRNYTGGLVDLKFDVNNNPHLIFTDIASSHANMNYFNLGNIRHAFHSNNSWSISTVYRQALPQSFFNAVEMYDMCLLMTNNPSNVRIIGQELNVSNNENYLVNLIDLTVEYSPVDHEISSPKPVINIYPNPFSSITNVSISYDKAFNSGKLEIYNLKGQKVNEITLTRSNLKQNISLIPVNLKSGLFANGVYLLKLKLDGKTVCTKKCIYLK